MIVPRTIAHFMPWTGIGGTEHATLRIAHAVRDRGFHSVAFCRDDAPEVHELFRSADVPTVNYHLTEMSLRAPMPFVRNTRSIARDLTRLGVDLLHCADVDAGIEAALAGAAARVPVLCHVRNPVLTISRRERAMLSPVSRFVFVSRDTWSTFGLPVGTERGHVLYDGIVIDSNRGAAARSEVRRELGLADDTPVVGMTARVSPQKDYITLARAAAKVREIVPNVRFVIVGDHEEQAAHREHFALVREELVRLGVLDSFLFTGFRSDVARVMRAFDVFVLSTHFEGLPLVILEAMSLGLPVVATAVNGIPEVIDRDEIGLLCVHEDVDALASRLIATLTDPALAARLGEAGRESVRQRFGMEAFAENVATLYREALLRRPVPGALRG
ncbi:MAG: glycosyltransferase family 4 protein [bacterium]